MAKFIIVRLELNLGFSQRKRRVVSSYKLVSRYQYLSFSSWCIQRVICAISIRSIDLRPGHRHWGRIL